jgi:outer membrane protein OmpA-like peptidoglycan-associated protein
MFRFVFFGGSCAAVMTAAGLLPTPSSYKVNVPEISIAEFSMPEPPAMIVEQVSNGLDLPLLGERVKETVSRAFSDPVTDVPDRPTLPTLAGGAQIAARADAPEVEMPRKSVNFRLDETELDAEAQAQLNELAAWLADNPATLIGIYGHTDLTGPEVYNYALGQNRAERVADYLIDKGIAPQRIGVVKSYGEASPLVPTERTSRENRRVQLETMRDL